MTPITALLIDDHAAVREGYRLLLAQFNITVIGELDHGEPILQRYEQLNPDIVIMDLSIKGMNGLDCTARLIQRYPAAKVIVFTMHDNTNFVTRAIQNGAMGYVLKSDPSSVLIEAIKQVYYQSKHYLSHDIANVIAMRTVQSSDDRLACLSDREHAIFLLLIEGKSRGEIAAILSIASGTVSNNKAKIMQKLQAKSIIDLITLSIENKALKQNQLDL
ncbi:MAG: response regulator transcription factor [Methylophaga sp.]|nr:response regulator transcription factor [Methylophaga sp.]